MILSAAWTKISLGDHGAKYLARRELCAPLPWSESICQSMASPGNIISDSESVASAVETNFAWNFSVFIALRAGVSPEPSV